MRERIGGEIWEILRIDFWRCRGSPPGGAGARAYIRMAKAYGNDDIYMRSRVTDGL